MQAVILAAGMGKRLLPLTKNKPKSMVELLGKPIIEYTMEALARKKVSEIIIVIGYFGNAIVNYFGARYQGIKIKYVENKGYETTNNIYSLKLALAHVGEDLILCEGDVAVDPGIFNVIDNKQYENLVFVGKYEPYMSGTIVKIDKGSGIINEMVLGARQTADYNYTNAYKTVNMYYLSRDFLNRQFKPALDFYLSNHTMNGFYEVIIGMLLYTGDKRLIVREVDNTKWFEIDDEEDLNMAEYLFSKDKFEVVNKLHGGYWRYKFMDFCYTINQHFPPHEFYSKLAEILPGLAKNYPSGHAHLCAILSRWYKEDDFKKENLILGNGASELIRIINKNLVKKITIPIPTFNEYENKLERDQINYFSLPKKEGFKLIREDFVESAIKSGSNAALIINPNNPTGTITTRDDLLWIVKKLERMIIIVDESFIDFSGDRESHSVQSFVAKFPSLVVIRSLSKEFGIPGLRLGYLLTTNKKVRETVLAHLPIWNINTVAEYFIESFPKYQDTYRKSILHCISSDLFGHFSVI